MPKFGSEKKVNTDTARESEVGPRVAKSTAEGSQENSGPAADKNVRAPQADKNVGVTRVEKTVATAREARGSGWMSQWGSKLSSLVSQKPKPTRSAIPLFNGVPVQGELSLDNIKVVRNDLSDADIEVVTRKMVPTVAAALLSGNAAGFADRNGGVSAPAKLEREMVEVES